MGNCVRCGRKKKEREGEESGGKKKKGIKSKKKKEKKQKDQGEKGKGKSDEPANGSIEEPCKVVKIIPYEETQVYASKDGSFEPQQRKILRLVLPYIPKKEWGKLREVCKTRRSVVDGEWARMHTVHLSELLPDHTNRYPTKKRLLLANHISSNCQLSKDITCVPEDQSQSKPVDLTDEEFWHHLTPRTNDLTTLKLHQVHLPKYFFTDFLPLCKNLQVLEIKEAPGKPMHGENEEWTDGDREKLQSIIAGLGKVSSVQLEPKGHRLSREAEKSLVSHPARSDMGQLHNWQLPQHTTPILPKLHHNSTSTNATPVSTTPTHHQDYPRFPFNCGSLTPSNLTTLSTRPQLTSLTFDLNVDHMNTADRGYSIRKGFSSLPNLRDLHVNIHSNESNVYPTMTTLAYILSTVAEHSPQLTSLSLLNLPDAMGIDKSLATDFSTAFVKLNDETQLENLHVRVLAPEQLFHVWSLPWPALTRLRQLTITDCNLYPQRPRGIDLEALPVLTSLTIRTDSLDDDMVTRVFPQQHSSITKLTLEPGPKGIGKRGMRTIAVACPNLRNLTVSYSRAKGNEYGECEMDSDGWQAFFHVIPDLLEQVTLVGTNRQYVRQVVDPVASRYSRVKVTTADHM